MNARPPNQHRRGFFEIDALFGLLIMSALLGTIVVAAHAVYRSTDRQADKRAALRLAERALLEPAALPEDAAVTFADLGTTPDGRRWVQATATVDDQSASLVGALPEVPR